MRNTVRILMRLSLLASLARISFGLLSGFVLGLSFLNGLGFVCGFVLLALAFLSALALSAASYQFGFLLRP